MNQVERGWCAAALRVDGFDVYKGATARGLLLDTQSDLLDEFGSRVVVPLMPIEDVQTVSRLHPVFEIEGHRYIMSTQSICFANFPVAPATRP